MNEAQARDEICRVGASLFARGYVHATAGNISVRLPAADGGGFLITPTDACLGTLDPARLAKLDDAGVQTGGDRASKTIALHRAIYDATAAAGQPAHCVIHTHSTHCVAASLSPPPGVPEGELLAPITPYFVMKVGHVPLVPYHRPGDAAAAHAVAQAIARHAARGVPIRVVMLSRLGPNVWHDTPAQAMAVLEELEETAKLAVLDRGAARPLDESQIEDLRRTFGAQW
ncbi:class II aldolase/adducin family protein [Caenimonas aquaedulcis]|uniref:Aldolase n=1 Tax=Caenimonas aquaedulcis TaxID=2793270 RepID=A0A931MGX9_9BURK|nr:aldolase [Caenimonas aquaedulcis]MBG9388576.1 aldolase [Caenimonas aquaedulcis]